MKRTLGGHTVLDQTGQLRSGSPQRPPSPSTGEDKRPCVPTQSLGERVDKGAQDRMAGRVLRESLDLGRMEYFSKRD